MVCVRWLGTVLAGLLALAAASAAKAADDPFAPVWQWAAAPTAARTATGEAGRGYFQQKVDYRIRVRLDEAGRSLAAQARIAYHNHGPQALTHLWFLIDQNRFRPDALREATRTVAAVDVPLKAEELDRTEALKTFRGGPRITRLTDGAGLPLAYMVVDALMRIDLPRPLAPGAVLTMYLDWSLPLIDTDLMGGRSGHARVGEGAGAIDAFQVGQWFPRAAAYDDQGWHADPFLGAGEFALEFGDYDVEITAPAGMVVAGTGELRNAREVLSSAQAARLSRARFSGDPVLVVTPQEARRAREAPPPGERTWRFHATRVRDFAFAASRAYLWDAMAVPTGEGLSPVLAMSFYPDEASALWGPNASRAMAHALKVFGGLAFPYPYPVVQTAWGEVSGYENPMLSFVDGLPRRDAKTGALVDIKDSERRLVSEVVHETAHNWFPEVVNSDERRFAWMDEGLVSYLQYQAMLRWDPAPAPRGAPRDASRCLASPKRAAVATRPDYATSLGCSAYVQPATALNVLREAVLGPAAFDAALRAYATRWRFRRATPDDFFRTFDDVTGADLGWFWRGWFFGTDHVDIALKDLARVRATGGAHDSDAFYRLTFENVGGLFSPIPLRVDFADGSNERRTIPVAVWRADPKRAVWTLASPKAVVSAEVDPEAVTGDVDPSNNRFPGPVRDLATGVTAPPVPR